jgi:hypothetical protein
MSALTLALAALLAMNPFEKNDPLIEAGTQLYEKGQFEEALKQFDEADKQHSGDPRVPYNRGLALHKLGKNDDARQALQRSLELDRDGSLAGKAHYNLGNVAAAAGDKKLALKEYREALKKNPQDELARHNYEVILKDLPPEKSSGDAGTPDGGHADAGAPDAGPDGGSSPDSGADAGRPDAGPDGGTDGGVDGGAPDGGAGDGGQDGGADGGKGQGDGGQGDGGRGDAGDGNQDKKADAGEKSDDNRPGDAGSDGGQADRDGGAPQESEGKMLPDGGVDVSRQDAERLLDSMKSTEKNMQLWRFRQRSTKSTPNGKDW